jgi:hypothetical protein
LAPTAICFCAVGEPKTTVWGSELSRITGELSKARKGRIITEIGKLAQRLGADSDTLSGFAKAAEDTQFSRAIDEVRTALRLSTAFLQRKHRLVPGLNQVECWFSILGRQALQGASFTSAQELRQALDRFIESYNPRAVPFEWKKERVHSVHPKRYYADLRH